MSTEAENFKWHVAYRLWAAAWSEMDLSDSDIDELANDLFRGPEATALARAGFDPVVIALREARRAELLRVGPDGGVLAAESHHRLLEALVERLRNDNGGYWAKQFTRALELAERGPFRESHAPLYKDVLDLLNASSRPRPRRAPPPPEPPLRTHPLPRAWVRGPPQDAESVRAGSGRWQRIRASAELHGMSCVAVVDAVNRGSSTQFDATIEKHSDLAARLRLTVDVQGNEQTWVEPVTVTSGRQRINKVSSSFKSMSVEVRPIMLRIATIAHAELNSYFVHTHTEWAGSPVVDRIDNDGTLSRCSDQFYVTRVGGALSSSFPGTTFPQLHVELRPAREADPVEEGPSFLLAFVVDYFVRGIIDADARFSKEVAMYAGITNEITGASWRYAQEAVFLLVIGEFDDHGDITFGADRNAYERKLGRASAWLKSRPCGQAVCLVPQALAATAAKMLPGVRVEGVASLRDLPGRLAKLVLILSEGAEGT